MHLGRFFSCMYCQFMYGNKCPLLDMVTELLPEWEGIQLEKLVTISEGTVSAFNQYNTYNINYRLGCTLVTHKWDCLVNKSK